MDHQAAMCGLHRIAQLQEQIDASAQVGAAMRAPRAQRFTGHEFHRQPRRAVLQRIAVENAADVGVAQPGDCLLYTSRCV